MSRAFAYDVALEEERPALLVGDRDVWREVHAVGRVHEDAVRPVRPILIRPAARLDSEDCPSFGNYLSDAFDAFGDGIDDAGRIATHLNNALWRWILGTLSGRIALGLIIAIDIACAITLVARFHHGG
ncbi:MAG: hypothetical protein ACREML_02500 [Vulcanimicrobiaceae bacterium]